MRKIVLFILALLLLGGAVFAGLHFRNAGQAGPSAPATARITRGDIESVVTAQGKLEPKDYVDVGAQVSGLVRKLHAEIGDTVKQGDLIAEIDPDVYEAQVRAAAARLKTLEAQMQEQTAQAEQARQKFERHEKLIKDKAVSREALEDAQTTLNIAQARLQSLAAQIEEAQSTLEGHQTNLGYTRIDAPMDGTVVSQAVKEGQTINANQTAPVIVQVANLSTMTVRAQVAEADVMKLTTDMPVYFTTLGAQGRRWQGTVRQILPSPENVNDVVLYNVLVDVDNEDGQLMTGMTTQMFFVMGEARDVPVIPVSALTRRLPQQDTADGKAYEIRMAGRQPQTRTVIVGLSDRTRAAIIDGLAEGDEIMIPALPAATQGAGGNMRRMPRL